MWELINKNEKDINNVNTKNFIIILFLYIVFLFLFK